MRLLPASDVRAYEDERCVHSRRYGDDRARLHMTALKRLDNIDVICADVERMVAFYGGVLGLEQAALRAGPGLGRLPRGRRRHLPDRGRRGPHAPPRLTGAANPPGIDSFAFEVDDLDEAIAHFDARRELGGGDRRVGVVPLPRTARSRGQPALPHRAATRPRAAGVVPGDNSAPALIDCDVHAVVGPVTALEPYLDDHWREVLATSQFAGPTDQAHPPNLETSLRADLADDGGARRASVATMRAQLLEPLGVELAILSCDYAVDSVRNPDAAAALASAVNDWRVAEWLEPEPRLRAAIVVATKQPALAAREIARLGDHPGFVAV